MADLITTGEAARRLNVSKPTLFYYERMGYLVPKNRKGTRGDRMYDPQEVDAFVPPKRRA